MRRLRSGSSSRITVCGNESRSTSARSRDSCAETVGAAGRGRDGDRGEGVCCAQEAVRNVRIPGHQRAAGAGVQAVCSGIEIDAAGFRVRFQS